MIPDEQLMIDQPDEYFGMCVCIIYLYILHISLDIHHTYIYTYAYIQLYYIVDVCIYYTFMFEKKQVPDFQAFLFLPATGSLTNSSRSFWLKQTAVARFWAKEHQFLGKLGGFFSVFPGWKL